VIDFGTDPATLHLLDSATGTEQSSLAVPGLTLISGYAVGGEALFFYDSTANRVKSMSFDGALSELPFVNSGTASFDVKFLPSPDGSLIAWGTSAFDPANGNATHITLNIANVDGSNSKTVLDKTIENQSILPAPLQWSPDGSKLYFTNELYGVGGLLFMGGPDLQQVDVATGSVTPILDDIGCMCAMAVSPDGTLVARITGAGPLELVIHEVATGKDQKAAIDPAHLQAGDILWAPDQKSLVYTMAITDFENPDNEKYAVTQVDAASLSQKVLVPDDKRLPFTALWPDSNLIWLGDNDSHVWLLTPGSGALAQVSANGTIVTNR
jgi:dipeptidyl aminopeptidase/acylaminoacyl peptidase